MTPVEVLIFAAPPIVASAFLAWMYRRDAKLMRMQRSLRMYLAAGECTGLNAA